MVLLGFGLYFMELYLKHLSLIRPYAKLDKNIVFTGLAYEVTAFEYICMYVKIGFERETIKIRNLIERKES